MPPSSAGASRSENFMPSSISSCDARRAFLDDGADDVFLAQPRARRERVAHVQLERVFLARHRRDAALGVIRVRSARSFLVTMATRPRGATFSAKDSPAMPLPRTR